MHFIGAGLHPAAPLLSLSRTTTLQPRLGRPSVAEMPPTKLRNGGRIECKVFLPMETPLAVLQAFPAFAQASLVCCCLQIRRSLVRSPRSEQACVC
eukprot:767710-Hanusia_phi.AAC.3